MNGKEYLRRINIIECKALPDYKVWIRFEDGLEGVVNLVELASDPPFKLTWENIDPFENIRIDPITHTLTWGKEGEEVDISPSFLREQIQPEE